QTAAQHGALVAVADRRHHLVGKGRAHDSVLAGPQSSPRVDFLAFGCSPVHRHPPSRINMASGVRAWPTAADRTIPFPKARAALVSGFGARSPISDLHADARMGYNPCLKWRAER